MLTCSIVLTLQCPTLLPLSLSSSWHSSSTYPFSLPFQQLRSKNEMSLPGLSIQVPICCITEVSSLCWGRLEYLQRSPARRSRRRKENPVPGSLTGSAFHWSIQIQEPRLPGCVRRPSWRMCSVKRNYCRKSEEVKTGSNVAESFKKGYGPKRALLAIKMMMIMMEV